MRYFVTLEYSIISRTYCFREFSPQKRINSDKNNEIRLKLLKWHMENSETKTSNYMTVD
jgi:hypothetical protein